MTPLIYPGDFTAEAKKTSKRTYSKKQSYSSKYVKYTGKKGKYSVTVFLDSDMNGYYYYGNGGNGKLKLIGVLREYSARAANYSLYEYNNAGTNTAFWDVWLYPEGISGEMTTNGKTYEVELYPR